MADIPYWLVEQPRGVAIVPWSGEVVPVPGEPVGIPVPTIPSSVPIVGPAIQFIGHAEHAIWDDVWGWIKGTSADLLHDVIAVETEIITTAVHIAETYVGQELKAMSGFINDAFSYAQEGLDLVNTFAIDATTDVWRAVVGIDTIVDYLWAQVQGIENTTLPEMFKTLVGIDQGLYGLLVDTVGALRTWAIDDIYSPLLREVAGIDRAIRADVWGLVGAVAGELSGQINAERLERLAEIGALTTAVAAITTWVDDCGAPMCEELGPGSQVGNLLGNAKILELLSLLAGLLALADPNIDEAVALEFARVTGPALQAAVTNWLIPLQAQTAGV